MGRRKRRDRRTDPKSRSRDGARPAVGETRFGPSRLRAHLASRIDLYAAAATALVFGWHLLSGDEVFVGSGSDIVSMEYPLHAFATGWMGRGTLPLWNPYILGGVPFQAGVHGYLYPGWWSGIFLPTGFDISLGLVLHLMLAAAGASWMARARVESRAASYLAGISYALSGFFVLHAFAGHRVLLASAAWLPWVCGAVDRAARRGRRHLLAGAAIAALAILGGHYQTLYIGMGGLLLWLLFDRLAVTEGGPRPRALAAGRGLACWAAILAAGAAIAAVQILPALSVTDLSQRPGGDPEFAASFSSAPPNLLTYLVPHLFGNKVDAPFVGGWSYWESLGYLGLAPLALITFALAALSPRRTLPALIVAALGLVLSLGNHTPLFDLYLVVAPGADLFRAPGRFCLLATLFGSLLAAQGLAAWLSPKLSRRRRRVATAAALAVCVASVAAALWIRPADAADHAAFVSDLDPGSEIRADSEIAERVTGLARSDAARSAVLLIIAAALLGSLGWRPRSRTVGALCIVALAVVDLHGFSRPFLLTGDAERFRWPEALAERVEELPPGSRAILAPELHNPDHGAILGVSNPGGYDIFIDARYARYLNRISGRDPRRFIAYARIRRDHPLLRHLGAGLLISGFPLERGSSRTMRGFDEFSPWKRIGRYYLYRCQDPTPRAFVVHDVEVIPNEDRAAARLSEPGFDIESTAVLAEQPPRLGRSAKGDRAEIVEYSPNRVAIEVTAGDDALLVLSDNPHPGWSATVDGERVAIRRANLVMRALPIPPGEHLVEMSYLPGSFVLGAVVSALALLALPAVVLILRRRRGSSSG
ncbi:MAG: YfhO family protein [Polyangia bacterium]